MVKRIVSGVAALAAVCSLWHGAAFAQPDFKGSYGGSMRIRHEYWQNSKDMDNGQLDNRNFFRVKSSLWGQLDYQKDVSLYAKLTNEFKPYAYFAGSTGSVPDKYTRKKGYRFDINEVVFDNLYVDVRTVAGLPVDLRIGRQDFAGMYGEGFLLADGTPQDGSRTYYFNAAKASWKVDNDNTLDMIYINDPRDDDFLPVINRRRLINVNGNRVEDKRPVLLNTTDEQAGVLYWKNKSFKDLTFEGYYIFKYEAEEGGSGLQSRKGLINTLGSYAKYSMAPWTLRGQLAGQFGDYGNDARTGLGGYVFVDRDIKSWLWKPKASLGYFYLSGDKRSTAKNESWDPLFSRYPWISESYTNTIASDTGITNYWTNLQAYRTELTMKPAEKIKLSGGYTYLRANAQAAPSAIFSGTNRSRGQLLSGKIEYVFNKKVTTYFLGEYLIPGKFYKDQDPSIFLREEVQFKF